MTASRKKHVPPPRIPIGTRVRFTRENLGASERDMLDRVTSDCPPVGAEGVVVFAHPSPNLWLTWFYVEWIAPNGRKLYVGVMKNMVEVVS